LPCSPLEHLNFDLLHERTPNLHPCKQIQE
jgi:hypothetical protein